MAKQTRTEDAQMELIDHLGELRVRLFRAALYLVAGMIVAYNLYEPIYNIFAAPLQPILGKFDSSMVFTNVADPFLLKMQVAFIAGLTFAFPFITMEIWGFVEPALTPEERKPVVFLAPFSVLLFLSGIATAYASLPACYGWMSSFIGEAGNTILYQEPKTYILLTAKIMLGFGIAFELPVLLLFLARIGIINAELMTKYWRHATVGIFIAAATLTPSNDPLTMLMMAIPMAGLYILSIGLVRAFEPREGKSDPSVGALMAVSLAPVAILGAASFWLWRTHAFDIADSKSQSVKQVQKEIAITKAQTTKSLAELAAQNAAILERMEAVEKENAELRAKVEELTPAPPAPDPTPNPFIAPTNPEGGAPTP